MSYPDQPIGTGEPILLGKEFMHFISGFYPEGVSIDHRQSILDVTQKIIELAQISSNQLILDAGCGTGDITFEIAPQFPKSQVIGINIAPPTNYS